MRVLEDIGNQMKHLEISYDTLSKMLFVDVNTVKKTISPGKGNPTLSTLNKYASALGGEVVFLTAEALQAMKDNDISSLNASLKESVAQAEALRTELAAAKQRMEEKEKILEGLSRQLLSQGETINKLINRYVLKD